jgi:penicillin-binding protein 1A
MAKNTRKKTNPGIDPKRFVKWFWIVVTAPFALLVLLLALTATGLFGKLPTFEELEDPKSNLATHVYSEDGELLRSFFLENRSNTSYEDLSPALIAALVATEDKRYYGHSGIDFIGLARVVAFGGTQGGGSTITQQLAKNLYKTRETTVKTPVVLSKLKEWITAVGLEYNYTKEEIIAMYLNTMFYGHNAYGIESAARTFFNKTPDELTIEESAMLIGVVNAPTRYSPRSNPENALRRRNVVLARLRERGDIDRHQLDSLQALPITLDFQPISHDTGIGTYFGEMLRRTLTAERPRRDQFDNDWDYEQAAKLWDETPYYGWCIKNTNADGSPYDLYRDGLKIYTTVNADMQQYAEEALFEHLQKVLQPNMDRQVTRLKRLFNETTPAQIEQIVTNAMRQTDRYRTGKAAGASEEEITRQFNEPVEMRIFTYNGERDTLMTPRDSILHHKQIMRASFMAMDPANGHVKAYVGGPDFRYFKYDMVKQGKRQVGSTIKPFVYTFAMDQLGFTPCTTVENWPVTIETYNSEAWSPKEAGNVVYDGVPHELRWGLANSRNNYSAWIMKQARQPQAVADFIHKMGIRSWIDPVPALCLGTSDFSLYEMVGAYGTFANRGVFTEPIFVTRIEDRQGNMLATFTPQTSDAISEQTAYTMLDMLKNVVNGGTAGRLRGMYRFTGEMGGKTGTTNENSDAWFMGVTPKLVAGGWVGAEDRSVHLYNDADGARQALPIFAGFMTRVYANPSLGITQADQFPLPVGTVVYNCDSDNDPVSSGYILDRGDDGFE